MEPAPSSRSADSGTPLLRLDEVSQDFVVERNWFGRARGTVRAVRQVSLDVCAGASLGIVGESGCGKSTLARIMVGLDLPSRGGVHLSGVAYPKDAARRRRLVAPQVQMVFQDPASSFNPRRTALESLMAPLLALTDLGPEERRARAEQVLELVELPTQLLQRHPHEMSGGQAQRLSLARALALRPKLIILDEAVSSLDVSIQARVLRLLVRLRRELGLAYVFIGHDLAVMEVLCDELAVMYLGSIVERGTTRQVLHDPKHPYTRSLRSAVPVIGQPMHRLALSGQPPSPANPPPGCAFHTRCYRAEAHCRKTRPGLDAGRVDRPCACFFAHDSAPPTSADESASGVVDPADVSGLGVLS